MNEPEWIFPLEEMEIGQSFFIPTLKTAEMVHLIERAAKKAEVPIKIFITTKENHLGVRTWRIG